jgi:hypothetical protein
MKHIKSRNYKVNSYLLSLVFASLLCINTAQAAVGIVCTPAPAEVGFVTADAPSGRSVTVNYPRIGIRIPTVGSAADPLGVRVPADGGNMVDLAYPEDVKTSFIGGVRQFNLKRSVTNKGPDDPAPSRVFYDMVAVLGDKWSIRQADTSKPGDKALMDFANRVQPHYINNYWIVSGSVIFTPDLVTSNNMSDAKELGSISLMNVLYICAPRIKDWNDNNNCLISGEKGGGCVAS